MGWLEEHIRRINGTGKVRWSEVARELRSAPSWKGLRIHEKSLATYLGAFDKGKNLELLERHPQLRALLAEYLQLSEEAFNEQFVAGGGTRDHRQSLFTIWDASTRPINLSQESLPDAFPPEVLDPRAWAGSPILWRAPNGSGRTLVGEWHRAQGRAHFIEAESWSEAQRQFPRTGRVFIELKSPAGILDVTALPTGLDVCVAVDGLADYQRPSPFQEEPRAKPQPEPPWTIVDSPPVEHWLEQLVFWIEERRASAEGFDPSACLEWLRKDIIPLELIDGFETAVGFVGVYAEFERKILRAGHPTSQLELARYFLRVRLLRIPAQDSALDFNRLWVFCLQIAHHLLVHGETPWFQARPIEEWRAIARNGPGASEVIEWLSAVQKVLKLSQRDLQKAAEALPPTAFQQVRTLQQLFLLREQQPGLYALRPSWVFETLLEQGADTLLQQSAETWGEALLYPYGASFVLNRLLAQCRRGDFDSIRRMLSAHDRQSPAWVAALESSFVALGWTLVEGGDLPEELLSEVFDLQQQLTSEVNGVPLPRTLHGQGLQSPLLKPGHWLVAAHALAERRGPSRRRAHPVLDPWAGGAVTEQRAKAWSLIWNEFSEQPGSKSGLRLLKLYGRLFRRVGLLGASLLPFQVPELLLACFQSGELAVKHVLALHSWNALVPLLRPYMDERGQAWAPFARAIWLAWLNSKEALPAMLSPGERSAELWSFIPAEAILDERLTNWLSGTSVPFERFKEEQWSAFLALWPQRKEPQGFDFDPGLPWRFISEPMMRRALAEDVLGSAYHDDEARRAIWKQAPAVAREGLRDCVRQRRWAPALGLARTAPAEETPAVIALIREGLAQPDVPRQKLIPWLQRLISMRAPGWKDAWKLRRIIEEGGSAGGSPPT